jgi:hypothetical protein
MVAREELGGHPQLRRIMEEGRPQMELSHAIAFIAGGIVGAFAMALACISGQSNEREEKMMKDARRNIKRTARRMR